MNPRALGLVPRVAVPRVAAAAIACALATAFGGGLASAQENAVAQEMQVEVRTGLTVGSHSGSAAALDIAPSLSVEVAVRRQMWRRIALFAGYHRTAFGCEEGYCTDQSIGVTGNHVAVGAEWGSGGPWVRLGLMLGAANAGTDGDPSRLGAGVLGSAGLSLGSGRVRFMPGVSYRWMSANTDSESHQAIALALDLGLAVRVGGG